MLLTIPGVLNPEQVRFVRNQLEAAGDAWVDGRVTAGHQGAPVKRNLQIAEQATVARGLGDVILAALEINPLFISAALPNQVYPPMFNRVTSGCLLRYFATDSALRLCSRIRSASVSMPCKIRNALNGLIAAPRSRSSVTRALSI